MFSSSREVLHDEDRLETPLLDDRNEEENQTQTISTRESCSSIPARHVIAFWAFIGFLCLYSLRVNLSVAIVAMTVPQHVKNESIVACPSMDPNDKHEEHLINSQEKFDWSPKTQGLVLAAFFYGYVLTQIIGGRLAERFGAKWIFGGSILVAAILTLLAPIATQYNVAFLILIRLLVGAFEAPAFPSAAALWGRWIPPLERSTIPPIASTGKEIGIILTTIVVSPLIAVKFLGGWPSAFYIPGIFTCLWFIGWSLFVFNSPCEHPRISYDERLFLLRSIPKPKKSPIPWSHILTCKPLYGIAVHHICTNFAFYILLTSLPTYFATILRFNLKQNGLMFAVPYIFNLIFTIVSGKIADKIRSKGILSTTATRRWQTIIGGAGTSIFLVLVGLIGCNHVLAVIFISLSIGFMGFQSSGSLISHLDIASNYAGTLVGITNMLAAIPGFVGPIFVGWVTNNNQTIEAWQLIFNVSSGIIVFGCIIYCLLFDGEEQRWNRDDDLQE